MDIVMPFTAIQRDMLALVGGKGANLGEMVNAGLPIPPGFCITTAAYKQVAAESRLEELLDVHAGQAGNSAQLAKLAQAARARVLSTAMPEHVAASITEAYGVLGSGEPIPVAVRSSATAEDLPFASFAGQQDTYLNIVGVESVLDAVQRCWASLWTERAVSYRASLGLDQRGVQLAVVVQLMVEAEVAGVLFTANPVTGQRRQAVIDANPGLGEAVVSGATNPDHFVVNTASGEIIERRIGDKRLIIRGSANGGTTRTENGSGSATACLSDTQIRELAQLGARVEAHYAAPQDTEWVIDAAGKLWLTQARPITTLYPLPANAPNNDNELRIYLSLNVFQGVLRPFTPMGIAAFRLIGSTVAGLFDLQISDPLRGPSILVESGSRLFLDVTAALRTKPGRRLLVGAMGLAEARSGVLIQQLLSDPRLSLKPMPRWRVLRAFGSLAAKMRAPFSILRTISRPAGAVERMQQARTNLETLRATLPENSPTNPVERLHALEQVIPDQAGKLFCLFPHILICGLGSLGLASKLLKGLATPDELQIVMRALPHNPTIEMDLDLWTLSRQVAADNTAVRAVRAAAPEQLAQEYRAGTLPPVLQQGLAEFLYHYGHRGVAEIDLGLPRWREDPAHILGVLANYLHIPSDKATGAETQQENQQTLPPHATTLTDPHIQFKRGAQEAEAMVTELIQRAKHKGRVRGMLVGFFLKRARALAGLREMPKFCLVLLLASIREMLLLLGEDLARAGSLENSTDIFFLTLQEVHAALAGENMRELVRARQADYDHELQRRHVPRVLLSNGTEPTPVVMDSGDAPGTLRGTPASPGRITGLARVILDPNGAHLEPGEILIAPSTDPGWTPLFLTAGGLVMEMGGAISHGAVVAREYGIPAVVGVAGATEHITSGQQITIDGAAGTVTLKEMAG
ncbi:MAG TPA: PEP/pyruvate-binding domain-containing protein [Ktedonobacteraceae bacterium]